jgi:hypothetical protein
MGDSTSGGRFSPPAWRRDANGNRSSGFWNRGGSKLGKRSRDSRESSPEYESADDGEDATLAAAARIRLPTGSLSPEKRRSPSPEPHAIGKIKEEEVKDVVPLHDDLNNCMEDLFYLTYKY